MGCKADFAANSLGYWQEIQRRRPPESGLSRAARSYAEGPLSCRQWPGLASRCSASVSLRYFNPRAASLRARSPPHEKIIIYILDSKLSIYNVGKCHICQFLTGVCRYFRFLAAHSMANACSAVMWYGSTWAPLQSPRAQARSCQPPWVLSMNCSCTSFRVCS